VQSISPNRIQILCSAKNVENRAESICKIWTVNICYVVHFGGRFGTNVKSPDMGLEKRTQGALGANQALKTTKYNDHFLWNLVFVDIKF
jgi:hypothetical protein